MRHRVQNSQPKLKLICQVARQWCLLTIKRQLISLEKCVWRKMIKSALFSSWWTKMRNYKLYLMAKRSWWSNSIMTILFWSLMTTNNLFQKWYHLLCLRFNQLVVWKVQRQINWKKRKPNKKTKVGMTQQAI